MPPRAHLTSSFAASDANNEVVCPLKNHDGSSCRKRCSGEKRFRSMQEHIRRAHPEHYIAKLPATEESFLLMINTPPSELPPPPPQQPTASLSNSAYGYDRDTRMRDGKSPLPSKNLEDVYPAAATAAVALAQLHHTKPDSDRESDAETRSERNFKRRSGLNTSVELPSIQDHLHSEAFPSFDPTRPRELLPSILSRSPPGRSSTLPPIQRRDKATRPRKSSISKSQHKPKHERGKSKEYARRLSIEGRKAFSAEPMAASKGSRWEDLVEAAASANEAESDRDLTPIPQSPTSNYRASLPPFPNPLPHSQRHDAYKASPLQHALTPPPVSAHTSSPFITPYPTIEPPDSSGSGQNFHISASGLTNSTPSQHTNSTSNSNTLQGSTNSTFTNATHSHLSRQPSQYVEIYCAGCHRPSVLKDSFACTECISGFCSDCVYALSSQRYNHNGHSSGGGGGGLDNMMVDGRGVPPSQQQQHLGRMGRGGRCPRCGEGARYKAFQLDIR